MLFIGGDLLVRTTHFLSIYLKKRVFFVSMLLLGMGSSAPELFVTLQSHLGHESDLAFGNIIGSNIFNILIVSPLIIFSSGKILNRSNILKSASLLLITTLIAGGLALDFSFSRLNGIFLLVLFCLFLIHPSNLNDQKQPSSSSHSFLNIITFIITGFLLLFLGAQLTIDSSITLGTEIGLSKRIIGLFLLSIGTSLPELAIGIVALVKKKSEVALGSIIGSNAFNTFLIMGLASVISDLRISPNLLKIDGIIMYASECALFLYLFGFKKIQKWPASLFILTYILYAGFIFLKRI